jgi:hypothetical protein
MEQSEGEQKTPVESIDQALQAIKALAESVAPPSPDQVAAQDQDQQEQGMVSGYAR